jgi:hypothetical protein
MIKFKAAERFRRQIKSSGFMSGQFEFKKYDLLIKI